MFTFFLIIAYFDFIYSFIRKQKAQQIIVLCLAMKPMIRLDLKFQFFEGEGGERDKQDGWGI